MKEIMAILRPSCSVKTREQLAKIGFPAFTGRNVNGRGKAPVDVQLGNGKTIKSKMLPKRMLLMVVRDEEVEQVITSIMETNCSQNQGDGKIFVSDVIRGYTISTGKCTQ